MVFSVTMLAAEYIVTLASEAEQSHFAFAFPAEALVNLRATIISFLNSYLHWQFLGLAFIFNGHVN